MSSESIADSDGLVDTSNSDISWGKYFRYDAAYKEQYDGIERFLDILKQNGFYSMEGPCGTGKTLVAVTAGIEAMRNDSYPSYNRTCVLTPNKQQLNQFIDEMRGVNRSLPSGVSKAPTVVMKGRRDMMPYAFCDLPPFDKKSVSTEADRLRKMTREVIKFNSDIPLNWPESMNPPASSYYSYDWGGASSQAKKRREEHQYDPERAKAVRTILINKQREDPDYERLVVDGIPSPYPDVVPHTRHVVDQDELQKTGFQQLPPNLSGKFDPFYTSFFAPGFPTFDFIDATDYVFDRDDLFELGVKEGVCPHETMAHYGKKADVILGNYMHLFDPMTRNLTVSKMDLFDEQSIVVLDEAHRIEGKVRDMLSHSVDIYTLDKAINDVAYMLAVMENNFSQTPIPSNSPEEVKAIKEAAEVALSDVEFMSVGERDLRRVEDLLRFTKQKMSELAADHLQDSYPQGWQKHVEYNGASKEEIPLTSPQFPDTEGKFLRQVTSKYNDGVDRMKATYGVYIAINTFYDHLDSEGIYEREPREITFGKLFHDWATKSVKEYHREIILEPSEKESIPADYPTWVTEWTPELQLYNCIPTEELKDIFQTVGGGIFMSATLSPPEVFQKVVGVDNVPPLDPEADVDEIDESNSSENQNGDSTDTSRPSRFDQYPLRFPEENRLSVIADLPKFTSSNRGRITPDPDEMTTTRRKYADAITDICNSTGNILVCMPKYAEARWAYNWVKDRTEKPCYLDKSSTNAETTALLDDFFDDEYGVLFTSTRGTITEGVDYDGTKLHTCVVVGIPLIDTRPARVEAIQYAYNKVVPDIKGFDSAIKIPAVRKSRQSFGRVIRGEAEHGVRVLADERYGSDGWDGAQQYLSEQEQAEFDAVSPANLPNVIETFWDDHDPEQQAVEECGETGDQPRDSTPEKTQPDGKNSRSGANSRAKNSNETQGENVKIGKVYLGKESSLQGWIPLPFNVIEEEIVPLVRNNIVEETADIEGIQFTSSAETSINGWKLVDADIVTSRIESIVKSNRLD